MITTAKTLARRILPAWLYGRMRSLWLMPRHRHNSTLIRQQRESAAQFQPRQVTHNYGGVSMEVQLTDPIAEQWYDRDWEQLPELKLLQNHKLKPGARVFDIGAHQCVVAMMMANIVGPEGFVLALEANPHNAAVGETNKALNRVEQLHIVQAAVAEKRGTIIMNELLNGSVDDGTSGLGSVEVASFSIDDLSGEHGQPDVLFIDVEGFECEALKGAHETMKARPDCFVEVHTQGGLEAYGGSVAEVVSFFPQASYDLYISSDEHHEFVPFNLDSQLLNGRFFLVAISRSRSETHFENQL